MIMPRKAIAAAVGRRRRVERRGGTLHIRAPPASPAPGRSRRRWKSRWPCGCCAIACRPRPEQQHNPLGADAADVAAGRDLFRQNCEICHGYDGSGKTRIGGGRISASARSALAHRVDDRWRGFLSHPQRHKEHRHAGLDPAGPRRSGSLSSTCGICRGPRRCPRTLPPACRTGSRRAGATPDPLSCKACHSAIYDRWKRRRWPTSCATRASIRTPLSQTSPSPTRLSIFPRTI